VRPPHLAGRHPGGARDRLDHHPFERTLMQLASDQPDEEVTFAGGGPAEEAGQQPLARRLGPGPGHRAHLREHGVHLAHGQGGRRLPRRSVAGRHVPERRVAHADLALAQLTREEGDHDRHFRRAGRPEQGSDLVDLDATPWSGRHGLRCEHELG